MKYIDQLAGKAGIAGREKGWAINDEKKRSADEGAPTIAAGTVSATIEVNSLAISQKEGLQEQSPAYLIQYRTVSKNMRLTLIPS